ncbi:DUF1189 domain-containing protein [Patescibacteria group bacterium]|nr:DUF1189 domain-containing protein [Patescibacteria group bacterium]
MLSKLKTFFRSFYKSCTDPKYYNHILKAPTSFSWKFFHFYNLLSALIIAIPIVFLLPKFNPKTLTTQIFQFYPQDLAINIQNGQLSINQTLPYSIKYQHQNIITFEDDQYIKSIKDIPDYNSPILITQSTIYVLQDPKTNKIETYQIPANNQLITIDKNSITQLINKASLHSFFKFHLYIPVIFIITFFFLLLAITIGRYSIVLIYSIILFLVITVLYKKLSRIRSILNFSKTTQLTIHSSTPIILASDVFNYFNIQISPFLKLITFIFWSLLCISHLTPTTKTTKN